MNKGIEKIQEEIENFRENILKMTGKEIYYHAGVIVFTEAAAYHIRYILRDDVISKFIVKEDKTLNGVVKYVMGKLKNKYAQSGDMKVKELQKFIWEYYGISKEIARVAMTKEIAYSNKKENKNIQKSLFDNVPGPDNKEVNLSKKETEKAKVGVKSQEDTILSRSSKNVGPLQIQLSLLDNLESGGGNND